MFLGIDFRGWILSLIIVVLFVWGIKMIWLNRQRKIEGVKVGVIIIFWLIFSSVVAFVGIAICLKPTDDFTAWSVFLTCSLFFAVIVWNLLGLQKTLRKTKGE